MTGKAPGRPIRYASLALIALGASFVTVMSFITETVPTLTVVIVFWGMFLQHLIAEIARSGDEP